MQYPQINKKNILTILMGAGEILLHKKQLAVSSE